jgi:putative transcription antitermination factor YqgF
MGFPHDILPNTPQLHNRICSLIAEKEVGAVVIGDSHNLKGEENTIAPAAQELGKHITEQCGIPVFYESEVFTSAEARRATDSTLKTRKPKSTKPVDASAAALILTSYLDKHAR